MNRICMIAYTFYELDNRVRRYAEALADRGDHVDVIALLDPTSQNRNNLLNFEILNGVHVYRIQKRRIDEKGKLSYLFRLTFFLFNSSFFLFKKYAKMKYQFIHIHSIPDFEVFAAFIPKLLGAKIILDIHDIVPEFYISKFNVKKESLTFKSLIYMEKKSIAFSDHLIIANHLWEEKIISRSVIPEKCSVFLNYPDQSIFFPRQRTKNSDKFILIYPGSLSWHQGLDIAIRALAIVIKKIKNIELHIYGDGSEKSNILKSAEKLNVLNAVKLNHNVPLEGIAEAIANSDIGLVPKRKDSFGDEAFSTKIFEFMSVGIPVIASNTKIDKFYFDDSMLQFFESGDSEDLAKKIIQLYENPRLRESLIIGGCRKIEQNTWGKHKNRYFDLVDTLIKKKD